MKKFENISISDLIKETSRELSQTDSELMHLFYAKYYSRHHGILIIRVPKKET